MYIMTREIDTIETYKRGRRARRAKNIPNRTMVLPSIKTATSQLKNK